MPMMPDQIKIKHCYRLIANNQRRIVARVLRIIDAPVRIAEKVGGGQSFTLRNKIVRFEWRSTAPNATWSGSPEQIQLAVFALAAEIEVKCDLP